MLAKFGLLLDRETNKPPAGAAAVKFTVATATEPAVTFAGLIKSAAKAGLGVGFTVTVTDLLTPA